MSVVVELQEKLAALREKAEGELAEVADKVQEAVRSLLDDDGVADDDTERVAEVLKGAADKLNVVADKAAGLFESEPAE